MIIYTHQKSKKRKPTAKQKQLQAEWEELIQKHTPKTKHFSAHKKTQSEHFSAAKSFVRETEYIPSLNTGYYNTFKKPDMYYTGDNMKGIGTLHKSNAVPIFTDEEAKDQANMRR
jgi:hypothetical protein